MAFTGSAITRKGAVCRPNGSDRSGEQDPYAPVFGTYGQALSACRPQLTAPISKPAAVDPRPLEIAADTARHSVRLRLATGEPDPPPALRPIEQRSDRHFPPETAQTHRPTAPCVSPRSIVRPATTLRVGPLNRCEKATQRTFDLRCTRGSGERLRWSKLSPPYESGMARCSAWFDCTPRHPNC